MLQAKDQEMINLALTLLDDYLDSFKKYKIFKENYFPTLESKDWRGNKTTKANPSIPHPLQVKIYQIAKANELLRRKWNRDKHLENERHST